MNDSNLNDINNDNGERTVTFDYIKSNFFRVIYADGVMGNINAKDNVHLVLWNERGPIPRQEVYELTSEGTIGDEIDSVTRDGMVREVEVDIILTRDSASSLRDLLDEILSEDD
jgi:hypothetical protein